MMLATGSTQGRPRGGRRSVARSRRLRALIAAALVALTPWVANATHARASTATGTIVARIAFYRPPTSSTTSTTSSVVAQTTSTLPEMTTVISTGFPPGVMLLVRDGRPYAWTSPTFPNVLVGPGPIHILRIRVAPGHYLVGLAGQWRRVTITAGRSRTADFCYFGCPT
jgi:hypothetical protein